MVVGIDPSFSNTGVCIASDDGKLRYESVKAKQHGIYEIDVLLPVAEDLAARIVFAIKKHCENPRVICQEYPIMATRPGGVLTVLMTFLWRSIKDAFPDTIYYMIPSVAIKSLTGCTTGKKLNEWVSTSTGLAKRNNDESSAFVIALIGNRIYKGEYEKSYYVL